jgi:hypothetical protein
VLDEGYFSVADGDVAIFASEVVEPVVDLLAGDG